mgnify:CR=1 FL=1
MAWLYSVFQHTAARRRLAKERQYPPKWWRRFNTQPPEGGWLPELKKAASRQEFQHTAARRRLDPDTVRLDWLLKFQHTAARRRLGFSTKC